MSKELLFSITKDDFEWDYFRSGGKGGQHQNKTSSGVRCRHVPSGAAAECREERDQITNKRRAFKKCVLLPAFQEWLIIEIAKKTGEHEQEYSVLETADRSSKIRTYNLPANRVTDHRYGISLEKAKDILDGNLDLLLSRIPYDI